MTASSTRSGAAENQAPVGAAGAAAAKPGGGKPAAAAAPAPARSSSFASSAPPTPESSDPGALDTQASAASAAAADDGAAGGEQVAPASPQASAEAQKALGNEAFRAGRYDEAVRCFSAALQLRPGTAVYLGNRAAAHLMARRYPEAVQDSLAALELDPGFVKAYARAGTWELYRAAACAAHDACTALWPLPPSRAACHNPLSVPMFVCSVHPSEVWLLPARSQGGDADGAVGAGGGAVPPGGAAGRRPAAGAGGLPARWALPRFCC